MELGSGSELASIGQQLNEAGRLRIASLLRIYRERILSEWQREAAKLPKAAMLDVGHLLDDIPALLQHLEEVSGPVELPADLQEPDGPATERHAAVRRDQGYNLAEVAIEYALLRQVIIRVLAEALPSETLPLVELEILSEAIDRATLRAVADFKSAQERTFKALDRIFTAALSDANLEQALPAILEVLLQTTAAVDSASLLLREGEQLRVIAARGAAQQGTEGQLIAFGEGLAGRVAQSRSPLLIRDASSDPRVLPQIIRAKGTHALYGLPLMRSDELLGVAMMGSRTAYEFSDDDVILFRGLAARVSALLAQREVLLREQEARAEAERATARSEFLVSVSSVLATGLDAPAALRSVAMRVSSEQADLCTVHLFRGEVLQVREAGALAGEPLPEAVEKLPAQPPALIAQALAGGEVLCGPATPELFSALAPEPELRARLDGLRLHSALVAPIRLRERRFGFIVAVRGPPRASFTAAELPMFDAIASRAAVALENARLYRTAQDAVAARGEFLLLASHELKTPLTPMMLRVQSLARELARHPTDPLAAAVRGHLTVLERQVNRMSALVEGLLDVSRIETGRMQMHLEEVDLCTLARDVVNRYAVQTEHAGSRVTLRAPDPVVGRWDPMRVDEVLSNLLSNAIKYGAGKPISMSVEAQGEMAILTVADQGIGIAKKDLARIFERFERAVPGREFGGLGLGLYIVREIVKAMGGRIDVTSSLGRGATFSVHLPLNR